MGGCWETHSSNLRVYGELRIREAGSALPLGIWKTPLQTRCRKCGKEGDSQSRQQRQRSACAIKSAWRLVLDSKHCRGSDSSKERITTWRLPIRQQKRKKGVLDDGSIFRIKNSFAIFCKPYVQYFSKLSCDLCIL